METNEIYAVRLEKKGVKPTAVRILVLKAMLESPCALSLIELETLLGTVDRSTIFRTLNHFLEKLTEPVPGCSWKMRLKLRYACLRRVNTKKKKRKHSAFQQK